MQSTTAKNVQHTPRLLFTLHKSGLNNPPPVSFRRRHASTPTAIYLDTFISSSLSRNSNTRIRVKMQLFNGDNKDAGALQQAEDPDEYQHDNERNNGEQPTAKETETEQGGFLNKALFGSTDTPTTDTPPSKEEVKALQTQVKHLEEQLEKLTASHEQHVDQYKERTTTLLTAMRQLSDESTSPGLPSSNAGEGGGISSATSEERDAVKAMLDKSDEDDVDAHWDPLEAFDDIMSKGYLVSVERIRDRLLTVEWQLNRKPLAMKEGVAR